MTDRRSGLQAALFSAALALSAFPNGATPAANAPPVSSSPSAASSAAGAAPASAPSTDGSFQVTITLNANLAGLAPGAASGTWLCSARAMSKPAVDAEIAKIAGLTSPAARWEYSTALEYRAHYLGQQASVGFATAGGAYSGSQSVTIRVLRDDLVDTVTKRAIDQPAVLVGCWLSLANAAGQTAAASQAVKPLPSSNPLVTLAEVPWPPYLLASASVPND